MIFPGLQKKQRHQVFYEDVGRQSSTIGSPTQYDCTISGDQTTWSQDNVLWNLRNRVLAKMPDDYRRKILLNADLGGQFYTQGHEVWLSHPYVSLSVLSAGPNLYRYRGPIMATAPASTDNSSLWPPLPGDMSDDMIAKGTTAIARTVPTHPAAGVAQFIGELHEGLPRVPGAEIARSGRNLSRRAAGDYLNLEFGVKPFINDLQQIHSAIKSSNTALEKLKNDSGRLIRRRYSFPVERSIVKMSADGAVAQSYPPIYSGFFTGQTRTPYTWHRETTTRTWFSGAYTYHFDQGSNLWERGKRAEEAGNRLFGSRIDSKLLWELAPWSWAVDWVSNMGDVMANISSFSHDGLVMRWGYVMQEKRITDTHVVQSGLTGVAGPFISKYTTVVKRRMNATPYGFGLRPDWSDFSGRQLAILSALGITRA